MDFTDGELMLNDRFLLVSDGVWGVLPDALTSLALAHGGNDNTMAVAPPAPGFDLYAAGVTLYHLLTRKYPYGEIEPFQKPKFGEQLAVPGRQPLVQRNPLMLWKIVAAALLAVNFVLLLKILH